MRTIILAVALSLSFAAPVLADDFDDSLAKVKQAVEIQRDLACPSAPSTSLCRLEFMVVNSHFDSIGMRVSTAKIRSHMGSQVDTEALSRDVHDEMAKATEEYTALINKYPVKK